MSRVSTLCAPRNFDPCVGPRGFRLGLVTLVGALAVAGAAHAEDEAPPLSIYGAARLDVLADDARLSDIYQPRYVLLDPGDGAEPPAGTGALAMTPRLSRLGLGIDEWELDRAGLLRGEGKLEVDFAGGAGPNAIRLRHAYARVTLRGRVEVLAGQTWDLISPLFPSAQNDMQMLFAGNTGDRRPQLRLSMQPFKRVRIAVAAASTGVLDPRDLDADGQLDGMASAMPMLQGLIEITHRLRRGPELRVGVWGHLARDQLADGTLHPASSIGAHAFVPLGPMLVWISEAYAGRNLADIGGGIGQGVNPMTGRAIRARGGWTELAVVPTARHLIALGASGDFARAADVAPGARTANGTIYGVVRYKPKTSLQLGLEYLYWKTRYRRSEQIGEEMSEEMSEEGSARVANRINLHLSVFF